MRGGRVQFALKRDAPGLSNPELEQRQSAFTSAVSAPILLESWIGAGDALDSVPVLQQSEWVRMARARDAIRRMLPLSIHGMRARFGRVLRGQELAAYYQMVQVLLRAAPDALLGLNVAKVAMIPAFQDHSLGFYSVNPRSGPLALYHMPEHKPFILEANDVDEYRELQEMLVPMYDAYARSALNDTGILIQEIVAKSEGASASHGAKYFDLKSERIMEFIQEFCGFYESDEAAVVDLSVFEPVLEGGDAEKLRRGRMRQTMQWGVCGKLPYAPATDGPYPWKPMAFDSLTTAEQRKEAFGSVRVVLFVGRFSNKREFFTRGGLEGGSFHWVVCAYYTGVGPNDHPVPSLWLYDSLYSGAPALAKRYAPTYSMLYQLVRAGFFTAEGVVTQDLRMYADIEPLVTGAKGKDLTDMVSAHDILLELATRLMRRRMVDEHALDTNPVTIQVRAEVGEGEWLERVVAGVRTRMPETERAGWLHTYVVRQDRAGHKQVPALGMPERFAGKTVLRTLDPWTRTCFVQRDSWECGYFVCAFAKMLTTGFLGAHDAERSFPPNNEEIWDYFQPGWAVPLRTDAVRAGWRTTFAQRSFVPMSITIPVESWKLEEAANTYGAGVQLRTRMYHMSRAVYMWDFIQYANHLRALLPPPSGAPSALYEEPRALIPRLPDYQIEPHRDVVPETFKLLRVGVCRVFEPSNDPHPYGLTPDTLHRLVHSALKWDLPDPSDANREYWFHHATEKHPETGYAIYANVDTLWRGQKGAAKVAVPAIVQMPRRVAEGDRMQERGFTRDKYTLDAMMLVPNYADDHARAFLHTWKDIDKMTLLNYLLISQRRCPHVPLVLAVTTCEPGSTPADLPDDKDHGVLVIVQENAGQAIGFGSHASKINSALSIRYDLYMKRPARKSPPEARFAALRFQKLLFQALWTLATWESIGFVHRDLWPPNIMVKDGIPLSGRPVYAVDHHGSSGTRSWAGFDPNAQLVGLPRFARHDKAMAEQLMFIDFDQSVFDVETLYNQVQLRTAGLRRPHFPEGIDEDTWFANTMLEPPEYVFQNDLERETAIGNTHLTDVWSVGFSLVALLTNQVPAYPNTLGLSRDTFKETTSTRGNLPRPLAKIRHRDWRSPDQEHRRMSKALHMLQLFGVPEREGAFPETLPAYTKFLEDKGGGLAPDGKGPLWTGATSWVVQHFKQGAALLDDPSYETGLGILAQMMRVDPYARTSAHDLLFPDGGTRVHPFFANLVVAGDKHSTVPLKIGDRQPWILRTPMAVPQEYLGHEFPTLEGAKHSIREKRHKGEVRDQDVFRTKRIEQEMVLDVAWGE